MALVWVIWHPRSPDLPRPIFFSLGCDEKVGVFEHPHTIGELKMAITEYIRNMDRVILNTVFENTVRCVNKYLETGGGHFEHYL